MRYYSMMDIQNRNMRFFSRDAMRFFRSRVCDSTLSQGIGGIFFVTSEQPPHGQRGYTIRQFDPETGHITTAEGEELLAYSNRATAYRYAQRYANEDKMQRDIRLSTAD